MATAVAVETMAVVLTVVAAAAVVVAAVVVAAVAVVVVAAAVVAWAEAEAEASVIGGIISGMKCASTAVFHMMMGVQTTFTSKQSGKITVGCVVNMIKPSAGRDSIRKQKGWMQARTEYFRAWLQQLPPYLERTVDDVA